MNDAYLAFEAWDPLASESDPGMLIAAQRREIRNILKSYTGYYDMFSELIQNALDAVENRLLEGDETYEPGLWIKIDIPRSQVSVTDNGCGMSEDQFKQFLRPNYSFKYGNVMRGSKGVGATYLAYGFNHLEVATKLNGRSRSGIIKRGREWVEDRSESIARPKVESSTPNHKIFNEIDRGTSMIVRLTGPSIRPRDLSWIGATTAPQWLAILRTNTPLGGVYLCGAEPSPISINVEVVNESGEVTFDTIPAPRYLYPDEVFKRTADIREFLAYQRSRVAKGLDVKTPPKFTKLNGLWGEWSATEILGSSGESPIRASLEENERALVLELGLTLRIFLAFSTGLWDTYNDSGLGLRKGHRLIRGGLQLCTRHMPQGLPLTIPMTNNIGFQNLAHVLVHFENAEPDLGRKGFQPDVVRVAEKLSVSAVTALRRFYHLLRKPGGAQRYDDELKIDQWKQAQLTHEIEYPLVITGAGLFEPTEELPIRSEPVVEQDVVALFNQMLSSGLVRGIQLISSSQFKQYDGLFRVKMAPPLTRYALSKNNPLGIDAEHFIDKDQIESIVRVLEYKFTVDGLIEEIQSDVKAIEDIGLVVAWELGSKWREMFDVTSYLDEENVHHRTIHGTTHAFTHSLLGVHAFEAIILKDLVGYLADPEGEQHRQREKLAID